MSGQFTNLIRLRSLDQLRSVVEYLNRSLLPAIITRYNSEFGPRYLGRLPNESIPTETRRLSEFRTRLGVLIEYGLGITIDEFLYDDKEEVYLSFVVNNQYPDFYVRDQNGNILLRIDFKSLHDESAEKSARFELPMAQVRTDDDLIAYVAWQWRRMKLSGYDVIYPHLLEGLFVPAIEIASERDRRHTSRGGTFTIDGKPLLVNGNPETNFGKIDRIVDTSRLTSPDLSSTIREFLTFIARHAQAVALAAAETVEATPTEDEITPRESPENR